jgi:hypothetical protein
MSHIDDLVKDFRGHLPDAPSGAAERAARRLIERSGSLERRARVGRGGRRVFVGVGALAVVAVAATLGALFIATNRGRQAADHGGWGLTATVRVVSNPGGPNLAAATARAVEVVNARALAQGLTGVVASRLGDGQIRLVAPQAMRSGQLDELLAPADVRIYDIGGALLKTTDPREAAAWLRAHARVGVAPAGYTALPTRIDRLPIGITAVTRAELIKAGAVSAVDPQIVAIPAGVRLLTSPRPGGGGDYTILRDEPVLRAQDLTRVQVDGTLLALDITAPAVARIDALLAGGHRASDLLALRLTRYTSEVIGSVTSPADPGKRHTGTLLVEPPPNTPASSIVPPLVAGGIDAQLSVESAEPYGDPPALSGDQPTTLPTALERSLTDLSPATLRPDGVPTPVQPEAVVHALTATNGNDSWDLYATRTGWRLDVFWIVRKRSDGASAKHDVSQAVPCDVAPGRPVLTFCLIFQDTSGRFLFHMVGRASPDVARVEIHHATQPADHAVVRNGWWLVEVPADKPAPTEAVAFDARGNVLAHASPPQ